MLYHCNQTQIGLRHSRWRAMMKLQNFDQRFLRRERARVGRAIALSLLFFSLSLQLEQAESVLAFAEAAPVHSDPRVSPSIPLKNADEDFIGASVAKYGSRTSASKAFAAQGWKLMRNNQRELALQDFIRAWQLDSKNYQAFWGFGAILSDQGKIKEAIEQLEMARELNDDSSQRVQLLTDLGILHSEYATRMPSGDQLGRAHRFVLANNRFAESIEIDQNDAASWRAWAISLYAQERYSEAWIKAKRAMDLKAEPFPSEFLKRLRQKVPESD
jgi:tetratricopeptide (TPR) repeat protein